MSLWTGQHRRGLPSLGLDAQEYLAAMHLDAPRRLYSQAHYAAAHVQHLDPDVVPDMDAFPYRSR